MAEQMTVPVERVQQILRDEAQVNEFLRAMYSNPVVGFRSPAGVTEYAFQSVTAGRIPRIDDGETQQAFGPGDPGMYRMDGPQRVDAAPFEATTLALPWDTVLEVAEEHYGTPRPTCGSPRCGRCPPRWPATGPGWSALSRPTCSPPIPARRNRWSTSTCCTPWRPRLWRCSQTPR